MWTARRLTGILVALGAAAPAVADAAATRADPPRPSLSAYHGLAAWVDIFDAGPWERPEQAVRGWARRDVRTVFVQTSNYRQRRAVHRPAMLARILASAHRRNMKVIAWYLPGFREPRRDWRRVKAAVHYRSPSGHRFDGFALDIEATAVRDIATRNRRMLALSTRLRGLTDGRYAVGAIIPDPVSQRYWPRFPYTQVRARYDVILPMSYWTGHARGERPAYRHTRDALRLIRTRTGDPTVPIHVIGGIASHASNAEVRGFARAATAFLATGASLYDAAITTAGQWNQLSRIGRLRAREPAPIESSGGLRPRRGVGSISGPERLG